MLLSTMSQINSPAYRKPCKCTEDTIKLMSAIIVLVCPVIFGFSALQKTQILQDKLKSAVCFKPIAATLSRYGANQLFSNIFAADITARLKLYFLANK